MLYIILTSVFVAAFLWMRWEIKHAPTLPEELDRELKEYLNKK